jgi:PAS domain S-box-containing protein
MCKSYSSRVSGPSKKEYLMVRKALGMPGREMSTEQIWASICQRANWGAAVMRARDDVVLIVNQAFARMHHVKEADLLGKPFSSVLAPESREHVHRYTDIADQWGHYAYECFHLRNDSSRFVALTELTVIKDLNGSTTYHAAFVLDISERKRAEQRKDRTMEKLKCQLEERTAILRQVSRRLLRAQDDEDRRIARELHDSLGQYLTALKINLDRLAGSRSGPTSSRPEQDRLSECLHLVKLCIDETRTLSHLLHPPLLDEAGFTSAARLYIDGFSKRTGIQVNCILPQESVRLPSAVELALFRTLQESLTNVYRHSGSKTVQICFVVTPGKVSLQIRDRGIGINSAILREFQERGRGGGVGLSGTRERMKELEGDLNIDCDTGGTTVTATIPVNRKVDSSASGATA